MARQITLDKTYTVVVVKREEERLDTDKISVDFVYDDGFKVTARLSFFSPTGLTRELILWEGQEYSEIGQWTDSDVELRIKQLLNVQ